MSRMLQVLWVAGLSGLLGACGGSGGGDSSSNNNGGGGSSSFGNTIPPSSGPGDTENLFPNATGNAWYYDSSTTDTSGTKTISMDRILITGQKTVLGQSSSIFQDTVFLGAAAQPMPTEDYYFKNAGGVSYMGSNDPSDPLSTAFVPYIEALFPVAPATVASFSKSNVDLGDLDGDGKSETTTLTLKATVDDFEALDTALGPLARTLRSTETLTGTVTLSSDNSIAPLSATTSTWSAPGIGVVKRTVSVTVQGQTQSQEFDIRGYLTDTAAQGLTTPYVINNNLGGRLPNFQAGQPALATDGTNFLALEGTSSDIAGSLFDRTGKVLGTLSLPTSNGVPSVSWDGSNYIIALTGLSTISASDPYVHVHRVTAAGVDLDAPNGITVTTNTVQTGNPAVASGAGTTLIAFSRYDSVTSQHLLYGVLVDQNGQVIAPGEFPIATDLDTHLYPQVSFDGTNFLVVWQQGSQADPALVHISGTRVSPAGAVLDSPAMVISSSPQGGQFFPVVAFDGTNYFVAWQDGRRGQGPAGIYDVFGSRVSPAGVVLDVAGIAVEAGGSQHRAYVSIAYSGSDYLIAWSDYQYSNTGSVGARLARMTSSCTVTTPLGGLAVSGAPQDQTTNIYGFTSVAAGASGAAAIFVDGYGTGTVLATLGYGL